MKKILVHGFGHRSSSWDKMLTYITNREDIICIDLPLILREKEISYDNLYSSFAKYCNEINGKIHLCGISLGGILALNYSVDFPDKVETLILIGTPHKIPKLIFAIQNVIFRFLPKSTFENMAFDKKDALILINSMKYLDFRNKLKKFNCPTLVICGKKDNANMKSAYYFSENIKNAKLKIIENAGHVVNEEKPEDLAQILNAYYSKFKD